MAENKSRYNTILYEMDNNLAKWLSFKYIV